jgi:hypothetical protein
MALDLEAPGAKGEGVWAGEGTLAGCAAAP